MLLSKHLMHLQVNQRCLPTKALQQQLPAYLLDSVFCHFTLPISLARAVPASAQLMPVSSAQALCQLPQHSLGKCFLECNTHARLQKWQPLSKLSGSADKICSQHGDSPNRSLQALAVNHPVVKLSLLVNGFQVVDQQSNPF